MEDEMNAFRFIEEAGLCDDDDEAEQFRCGWCSAPLDTNVPENKTGGICSACDAELDRCDDGKTKASPKPAEEEETRPESAPLLSKASLSVPPSSTEFSKAFFRDEGWRQLYGNKVPPPDLSATKFCVVLTEAEETFRMPPGCLLTERERGKGRDPWLTIAHYKYVYENKKGCHPKIALTSNRKGRIAAIPETVQSFDKRQTERMAAGMIYWLKERFGTTVEDIQKIDISSF